MMVAVLNTQMASLSFTGDAILAHTEEIVTTLRRFEVRGFRETAMTLTPGRPHPKLKSDTRRRLRVVPFCAPSPTASAGDGRSHRTTSGDMLGTFDVASRATPLLESDLVRPIAKQSKQATSATHP
jgi:hypothetical protein